MIRGTNICVVLPPLAIVLAAGADQIVSWGYTHQGSQVVAQSVTSLTAGGEITAAVDADGKALFWGDSRVAAGIPQGVRWRQLAVCFGAASHGPMADAPFAVAVSDGGAIHAWGNNCVYVFPVSGSVQQIAASRCSAFALRSTGEIVPCASLAPPVICASCIFGEHPGAVPGPPSGSHVAVAGGYDHMLAIRSNRTVACWGRNWDGQCDAPGWLSDAVAIGAGEFHSVAVRASGQVIGWGSDLDGQSMPPSGFPGCVAISSGSRHNAGLTSSGAVQCFGANDARQCDVPPDLGTAVAVACGSDHTVALLANGGVRGWGLNSLWQQPVAYPLGPISSIDGGWAHVLALVDGVVVGWGSNQSGQLDVPAPVANGGMAQVHAGGAHSLAIGLDGQIHAWGSNSHGQINVPPQLPCAMHAAAGERHSLGLAPDGQVFAWGSNTAGQSQVPPSLGPCRRIAAGSSVSAAVLADGRVVQWGSQLISQPLAASGVACTAHQTFAIDESGRVWRLESSDAAPVQVADGVGELAATGQTCLARKFNGSLAYLAGFVGTPPANPPATRVLRIAVTGNSALKVVTPICTGDLDGDGRVSGIDVGLLIGAWGSAGAADLNGDGVVSGADLGELFGQWGSCGGGAV